MGSSISISGFATIGSGTGSGRPDSTAVSATSTKATTNARRASVKSAPQLIAAGKSST